MRYILEERYILLEADDFDLSETDADRGVNAAEESDNSPYTTQAQKIIKLPDGKYNWAEMYKACNNPQDFEWFWHGESDLQNLQSTERPFKGYYREAWGNYAEMIENFGKVFTDDLLALGWFSQTNPFIAFLNKYFTVNSGAKKFAPDTYRTLHNAAAKNYIGTRDLNNPEETSSHLVNIIYAPDTFKNLGDTLKYLRLQQLIENAFDNKKIKAPSLRQAVLNLMLKDGDPNNLDKAVPGTRNLRPLSECELLILPLVDADSQATDTDINQAISKVPKADAHLALAAAVMLFTRNNLELLQQINKQEGGKLFAITDTVALTPKNQRAWQEKLGLKTKTFNPPELKKLIIGLLNRALN